MKADKQETLDRRKGDRRKTINEDEPRASTSVERAMWDMALKLMEKGMSEEEIRESFDFVVPSWYKEDRKEDVSKSSSRSQYESETKTDSLNDADVNKEKDIMADQQQHRAEAKAAEATREAAEEALKNSGVVVKGIAAQVWDKLTSPFSKGFILGTAVGIGGTVMYNRYKDRVNVTVEPADGQAAKTK